MYFRKRNRVQKNLGTESKTQAHLAQRTNVNYLMKQYRQTGKMPDPAHLLERQQVFMNCVGLGDFAAIQQQIVDAGRAFMGLDPRVRAKFRNRPENLMEWLGHEENRKEAEELGLIEKRSPEAPQPDPQPDPKSAA